jgi:hypothetical protein
MSAHTDRIANQSMIELAKKQYELDKRKTMPSEIFQLVSKGMVYPKDHPLRSGTIEMRYMTAYDEDILTNPSYMREGVVFDKLLDAIITTQVNINDIAEVDKDALIINARILAYGTDYPVIVKDPKTGKSIERVVDLSKIKSKSFTLENDENGEFTYTYPGNEIKFTYYNVTDSTDTSVSGLLKRIITEVNGSRTEQDIDQFLRYEFLSRDSKKFRDYYKENTPVLDYKYEFEGEDGSAFISTFPVNTDLFWF